MIKKIVKGILPYLYPYKFANKVDRYRDILYTHWIKNQFSSFGLNSILQRNLKLEGHESIIIGNNVVVGKNSTLTAWGSYMEKRYTPTILIGDNTFLGEYTNISAINNITLGSHVLLGRWVTIIDHSHGLFDSMNDANVPPIKRDLFSKGGIIIDDNVWIADKVTICPGVHIGKGSIVASNSVVTKNIPPYTMCGGGTSKNVEINQ